MEPNAHFRPWSFLGLPMSETAIADSKIVLLPVPYDSTTSFRTGTRDGPRAILEASRELEDYDPELRRDVPEAGIATLEELEVHLGSPQAMVERVRQVVSPLAKQGKIVGLLGGEHSIAIGAVQAFNENVEELSVLYLDAHGDLRDEYQGTKWGHASVARRLTEICPVVQAGIRSLSREESEFVKSESIECNLAEPYHPLPIADDVIKKLSRNIYVSIDLDVFDPSIMSAVGTPEPGGLDWHQVLVFLRTIATVRHIVGFDVSELCPREGPAACASTAAKLVYKLIGYSSLL